MKNNNNKETDMNKNNNNKGLDMSKHSNDNKGLDMSNDKLSNMLTKEEFLQMLQEVPGMDDEMKKQIRVLRSIYDLPVQNNLRTLQIKAKAILNPEWTNIELGDDSLHNGHKEFIYFINPGQDVVEAGLPAQINIYCNIDDDQISVAKLAKTYDENNDSILDMEWDDLEEHTFSWDTLSELIEKYRTASC